MVNEKWVMQTSLVQTRKFAEEVRKQLIIAIDNKKEVYELLARRNPEQAREYRTKIEALETAKDVTVRTVRVILNEFIKEAIE